MKLIFQGHDYQYAVEQSLLAFFPKERPVYQGEDPHTARVSLTRGKKLHTAVTVLTVDGRTARGVARGDVSGAENDYERERLLQRLVKLSFFKAAPGPDGPHPRLGRPHRHPPRQAGGKSAGKGPHPQSGGPGAAGYLLCLPPAPPSGYRVRSGGTGGQGGP